MRFLRFIILCIACLLMLFFAMLKSLAGIGVVFIISMLIGLFTDKSFRDALIRFWNGDD